MHTNTHTNTYTNTHIQTVKLVLFCNSDTPGKKGRGKKGKKSTGANQPSIMSMFTKT